MAGQKPKSAKTPRPKQAAPQAPAKAPEIARDVVVEDKPVVAAANVAVAPLVEAVETVVESVNEGNKQMANETTKTAETALDRSQAAFGDVNARTKAAMEKTTKLAEEVTELTKGNVEALVASSKIAARGVETLGQEVAEYGRKSFEDASAALKSFAEVKTPADLFKLQSEYAKTAFDSVVAESSKLSEAMLKLTGEVIEPITSRYSVAAERVKTLVAA